MAVISEVIVKPTCVCIRCSGTCTSAEEFKRVLLTAIAASQESQRIHILIDGADVTGYLSDVDRFEIATYLSELNRQEETYFKAIAIVGNMPLVDPFRFGETVARNRGVNGRVFTDIKEAIEWLAMERINMGIQQSSDMDDELLKTASDS